VIPILLISLLGCNEPTVPPACQQMCDSAAALYGGCLSDWGVDWTAAGYEDEQDFLMSCQTWSLEMVILEDVTLEDGLHNESRWLETTCTDRADLLSSEDAACSDYTNIDWNSAPWVPSDTGN